MKNREKVFLQNDSRTMRKIKTYMDKLMEDKEFRKGFDKEYQTLCIEAQIVKA